MTNLRVAGCGRLKSTVCGMTNLGVQEVSKSVGCGRFQKLRGAGGPKKCGVREVKKSAGCGRSQKKWGVQELETSLQFITAPMTKLKIESR